MKLLNHTLLYLSGSLLLIIGVWAVIFYFNMLDEVYDSIDDGLGNYKMLIIQKAKTDSAVLNKSAFGEGNYAIQTVSAEAALTFQERYTDTSMFMQNEEDFEPVRMLTTVFTTDGQHFYQLEIISSMIEEDDLLEDLLYALVWLYAALIVSIIIINNVLLKKIWNPFYRIISSLKNFKLGDPEPLPELRTPVKEFRELNEAVQKLLANNIEIYNQQKQFIENASHELQTPLAISINKLELLLEQQQVSDLQAAELGNVIENLERLTRLNKALLLISKIENRQFPGQEEVEMNGIVQAQLEQFSDLASHRGIFPVLAEEGKFMLYCNKDLALMLVGNLLKNAIVHNVEGGTLLINIHTEGMDITNTGSAAALDAHKLFSRFYKNPDVKNSTGLGLSIVKSIAALLGITVSYHFDGMHRFSIRRLS